MKGANGTQVFGRCDQISGGFAASLLVRSLILATVATTIGAQREAHATAAPLPVGDYTGDNKTDLTVFRPSDGYWYTIDSTTGGWYGTQWGTAGDVPVTGDFSDTPDGISDPMVFRPSTGLWYWIDSGTGYTWWQGWGGQGDIPAAGDYDGDGVTDITVWRHFSDGVYAAGMWWVINSHDWSVSGTQWGLEGDIPVACDYDGDGKSDYAVYRPSNTTWYIKRSLGGTMTQAWGTVGQGAIPVPADYGTDGKCDLAVWYPSSGNWEISDSYSGATRVTALGQIADIPTPGDYDGDGRADVTVWRPYDGTWYGVKSSNGGAFNTQWGYGGPNYGGIGSDIPLPNYPGTTNVIADLVVAQQQSQWCWAATTEMAAAYSQVGITQCLEANVNVGRTDCCTNPTSASTSCDVGGWWTLTSHGFTETDVWGSAISFATLQGELNANRPVPFAWAWLGGGGHAMVAVKTWVSGLPWVTVNNPLPVNVGAQVDMQYATWVSATDHTHWRDSYNVIRQ